MPPMGLTTFWPVNEQPKNGHLGDDADAHDFSKTFGFLDLQLKVSL